MFKETYVNKRQALIAEAENLINEEKYKDADEKVKEIETLDVIYENACKSIANLNAMKEKTTIADLEAKSEKLEGAEAIDSTSTVGDDIKDVENLAAKIAEGANRLRK